MSNYIIKAAEIVGTNNLLIKSSRIPGNLYLNGVLVDNKEDLFISNEDVLKIKLTRKKILHYQRDDEKISVEEYQSKPRHYPDGSSDEYVLRIIANKKELDGFKPVYDDDEYENAIIDKTKYIITTDSKFISCTPKNIYHDEYFIFTVFVNRIAMDEYEKLSKKHSDIADFEKPDRPYLRFVKINNDYAFRDCKPFGDSNYTSCFENLEMAKTEEEEVRKSVRDVVNPCIFKTGGTPFIIKSIISKLNAAKQCKIKKSSDEIVSAIIKELKYYCGRL